MKDKIRKVVGRYWVLIFFILIIVYAFFTEIPITQILERISSLTLLQLTILLSLYSFISLLSILSRKVLLSNLGYRARVKNLTLIHFSSMAAHYSTPAKIGFPLTVYLLKKSELIPYSIGTAIVLIELAVNMFICGILAVISSSFYFKDYTLTIIKISGVLAVLIIIFLVATQMVFRSDSIKKYRVVSAGFNILENLKFLNFKQFCSYCIIICVIQIISSFSFLVLCRFFGVEINIFQAVAATKTAFFIGALSMVPLGLGVRDGSMLFFMDYFGVGHLEAVSVVAMQRVLSTGLSFLLGIGAGSVIGIKYIMTEQDPDRTGRSSESKQ